MPDQRRSGAIGRQGGRWYHRPVRVVVTGVAGFIGSHIAEAHLARGDTVVGVDCFTEFYDVATKRANLARCVADERFSLIDADLLEVDLADVLAGVDAVVHHAAQPGVRPSWARQFDTYLRNNVLATQRLLEACRATPIGRLVYASSSSVYGDPGVFPTAETTLTRPYSPYGVTKLAGEHLVSLYAKNFGLPAISLRYFTVYGPRQRPDMAIHRLVDSALTGSEFHLYGDGSKRRDFTYVGDVVRANLLAGEADVEPGTVVNIAAGGNTSMTELIELVELAAGRAPNVVRDDDAPGDVERTGGDNSLARELLGWEPTTDVREGVARQVESQRA